MSDTYAFARLVLLLASVVLLALLSNRLTERVKIPAPLLVLVSAAIAVQAIPDLHHPSQQFVARVVTLCLLGILFDGGLQMGWARFRSAAVPIAVVGVLGTFLTAGATAVLAHLAFHLSWYLSLLVGTAISPTDPAVVFAVLGQRGVDGRSGTILEGESGANDPVGIALMASLITAGGLGAGAFGHIATGFLLQMSVGTVIGVAGARGLLWFMHAVPLPSEGLYPLRTAAGVLIIFAVASLAHGSGFLAVFIAGILLGDERAPYQREIVRFHTALASLGEIVAFVVLGLTVDLHQLSRADVWVPGLIIAVVVAAVIRPLFVGLCLLPAQLEARERTFVLFAGLKGAVPILLGGLILTTDIASAHRLYGIVVVVVIFSVLVQGSLVPAVATRLRLPMRSSPRQAWLLDSATHPTDAAGHRPIPPALGGAPISPATRRRVNIRHVNSRPVAAASVVVFDVNETLSDMSPLADRFEAVGAPGHLLATWFAATLRDGFALSSVGAAAPFAHVARGVLDAMWTGVPELSVSPSQATDHILAGFNSLSLHDDVAPGVIALSEAGHRLMTLSNGARSVAAGLLERAGLTDRFEHLLTVDDVGFWKPQAQVYAHAAERAGVAASQLVLVAVHPFDIDGAHRAGLRTAYLDRTGAPYPAVFCQPDYVIRTVAELALALA